VGTHQYAEVEGSQVGVGTVLHRALLTADNLCHGEKEKYDWQKSFHVGITFFMLLLLFAGGVIVYHRAVTVIING